MMIGCQALVVALGVIVRDEVVKRRSQRGNDLLRPATDFHCKYLCQKHFRLACLTHQSECGVRKTPMADYSTSSLTNPLCSSAASERVAPSLRAQPARPPRLDADAPAAIPWRAVPRNHGTAIALLDAQFPCSAVRKGDLTGTSLPTGATAGTGVEPKALQMFGILKAFLLALRDDVQMKSWKQYARAGG